jgi:DNA-binding NarL/FixJ family response regulator
VKLVRGPLRKTHQVAGREQSETTVLVAVEAPQVREALVAMLAALEGFRVVAEADTDEAALEAARSQRPRLALIEGELSDCRGWWAIQQIQKEGLADVVVALGRRADAALARMVGAQCYVQMGTSPRDLLSAVQAAIACAANGSSSADGEDQLLANGSGAAETEHHLLPDAHPVLEKPALVDF